MSTNSETSKADSGISGETGGPVQGANSVAYANINAALTAGETSISLTNDANFTAFALNSGAVTIDLAGHKLSLTGNTGDYTAITVTGRGSFDHLQYWFCQHRRPGDQWIHRN